MGSIWYNKKAEYCLTGLYFPLLPLENENDGTLPPEVNANGVPFNYKNERIDLSYNYSNIRRTVATARISSDADVGFVVGGWVKLKNLGAEYGDMLEILSVSPYLKDSDQKRVAMFPHLEKKLTVYYIELG